MFVNANYSREPEAIAMSAIHGSSADRADRQGAYFEGSLELLRELAVTTARCARSSPCPRWLELWLARVRRNGRDERGHDAAAGQQ